MTRPKAALGAGIETRAGAAVAYIAKRYGIEMNPQHFSSIKSVLKKNEGLPEPTATRASDRTIDGYLSPPPRRKGTAADEADLLAAMETIKPLIAALGAEKVKRIVDLLG